MSETELVPTFSARLSERLLELATGALKMTNRLGRTRAGRYLSDQLMRAAASAGANYQEACGAESRADFVHKLQIVLKELREAHYWLQLLGRSGLLSESELAPLLKDADELCRLVGKSVATTKLRNR
jgi:four helix bundle protein